MVTDKVHEGISIEQSNWLEKHTSFNTQKRNKVENDFEKDFFKLLSNGFSGKNFRIFSKSINIRFWKKLRIR